MAKSLAERITSAKSTDRVTITDLESLIADATAERDRLVGSADHHDAESINYALSDDDREEASRLASHYQRTARGLTNEINGLKEKLEEKRNSDKQKAEEERIAAIVAKRDDLAARLKDRLPAIFGELVGLLEEVETNDVEIQPLRLESAEAVARGVSGTFYRDCSPISRFLKMKIPAWDGRGLQWPIDRFAAAMAKRGQEEHRRLLAQKEAQRAEEARWQRYVIDPPVSPNDRITITTHRGPEVVRNRIERKMTAEAVAEARKAGLTVVALKPTETVGLPTDMAIA